VLPSDILLVSKRESPLSRELIPGHLDTRKRADAKAAFTIAFRPPYLASHDLPILGVALALQAGAVAAESDAAVDQAGAVDTLGYSLDLEAGHQ